MRVHKGEIEADRIVKNLARNVLIRAMLDLGIPVRKNCLPPSGPGRPCLPREPIRLMTRRRLRKWMETVVEAGAWMFGQPHPNSLYSFSTVSTLLEIDEVRLRAALWNMLPAEEREILTEQLSQGRPQNEAKNQVSNFHQRHRPNAVLSP